MKNILIYFTIFCLDLAANTLFAQLPSLQDKLSGKDRVEEIMEIVDAHYAEIASGKRIKTDEGEYKHWARWGLYMSGRTDAQGRLVDVDSFINKALKSYSHNQRNSYGNWISRGPTAISGSNGSSVGIGRVDRVAFHPTDANILYIGTPSGGLFKSVNGGSAWTALTDNIPSTAISGIVVSHSNPNTVYILTGDGDADNNGFTQKFKYWRGSKGVFVSYDAGSNWYPTGAFPVDTFTGYQLVQDPNNANILIAATSQGLFRTTNGGDSWVEVLSGRTYEIKFRPGSSTYVYATKWGKFYRSTNGGIDWAQITNFDFPLQNQRVALAVTNASTSMVYLMSGWANGGTFGGFYISDDFGASFTRQSNTPNIVESACDGSGGSNQSEYDLAIGVSHALVNRVVAAGITTWRSYTSGDTWINASAGRCSNSASTGYVHADVHDIEYNPLNGHVYLCSDGGLIKSVNHGIDWINLSDGIAASQVYHMTGALTDINHMVIGLQDNGCKSRNANTSVWEQIFGADGYDCIYNFGSSTNGILSANSSVYRFSDNGATTINITPATSDGYFPRVTSAIDDDAVLFAGYATLYKSINNGDSWFTKDISGNWDIERCPSNLNRLYAAGGNSAYATTGSMHMSADLGSTWSVISGNPGYPLFTNVRLNDIGVRPNGSGYVWIVFGGFSDGNKVFYSSNFGSSWTNKSGSLPNVPVNAIQVDGNNNVYIGTDIGVFYRGADMNDWVPFWHRLPIIPVTDLELYGADDIIRAATFGRGVWESPTYSTCSADILLGGTLTGNRYYEMSNSILSTAQLSGGQNTRVIFKAGNYTILSTGFKAGYGNTLHVYTAPCGIAQNEE